MLSTKTSKTGSLKICVTKCHSAVWISGSAPLDSRDEGANSHIASTNSDYMAEFEPSAHLSRLCHAEQSFACTSPICYPATLRFMDYRYSCMIHLTKVSPNFLNSHRAGSPFLFQALHFVIIDPCIASHPLPLFTIGLLGKVCVTYTS
jgi:hypothetical protein